MEDKIASPQLPGFRFRPTDEELLNCYLRSVVSGKKQQQFDVIGFLNIYGHDPRDLPGLAKIGEREWYFFVPRDRKPTNGWRASRTTQHGFWKATGSDHNVYGLSDPKRVIGYRKTLVFYEGRAPRGTKTDWVMQEYRLKDNSGLPKHQDMIVLCKVYKKATSLKVLEQMAASEEEYHKQQQPQGKVAAFQEPTTSSSQASPPLSSSSSDPATIDATASTVIITCPPKEEVIEHTDQQHHIYHKTEGDNNNTTDQLKTWSRTSSTSLLLPHGSTTGLQELQVPNLGWGDHDLYENSYQQSPFFDILTTLFTPSPNCSLLNI